MSNLITPEVTVGWSSLFTAKLGKDAKPTDKPKFGIRFLLTEAACKTPEFKAMLDAFVTCARETFGDKADAMIREESLRSPFRKDVVSKGYPETFYRFVGVSSTENNPPAIVGRNGKPITDQREIYPGAIVRVSLGVYGYGGGKTGYSAGVAFGLRNVQKLGDGPRIDNRSTGDEFGALPDLAPAAMPGASDDLAALLG